MELRIREALDTFLVEPSTNNLTTLVNLLMVYVLTAKGTRLSDLLDKTFNKIHNN